MNKQSQLKILLVISSSLSYTARFQFNMSYTATVQQKQTINQTDKKQVIIEYLFVNINSGNVMLNPHESPP